MSKNTFHKSVLIKEVLHYLAPQPKKLYLDATLGGGGHTSAILEQESTCRIIAIDWDKKAVELNTPPLEKKFGERVKVVWGNFAHLERLLKKENISQIDGILADFGTSQKQIFEKDGFSFKIDSPLDMRMSPAHQRVTAADVINRFEEKRLANIFFTYGEERLSRKIAKAIVEARKKSPFKNTKQLAEVVSSVVHKQYTRIHPATKVFQAIRIVVNHEMENIEHFLKAGLKHLSPEGTMVCISFHSLEDRLVKQFFRANKEFLEVLTSKPITPSDEEIEKNLSSRSSKLRAARKF
jgi:16S rRNA (cytosine1402-N4)-methyltransferase